MSDTKLMASIPLDVVIVSMIEFKGRILLATSKGVYALCEKDDKFRPLDLVEYEESK